MRGGRAAGRGGSSTMPNKQQPGPGRAGPPRRAGRAAARRDPAHGRGGRGRRTAGRRLARRVGHPAHPGPAHRGGRLASRRTPRRAAGGRPSGWPRPSPPPAPASTRRGKVRRRRRLPRRHRAVDPTPRWPGRRSRADRRAATPRRPTARCCCSGRRSAPRSRRSVVACAGCLAGGFHVVGWDLPGHGRSAPAPAAFAMAELAAGVLALADRAPARASRPSATPVTRSAARSGCSCCSTRPDRVDVGRAALHRREDRRRPMAGASGPSWSASRHSGDGRRRRPSAGSRPGSLEREPDVGRGLLARAAGHRRRELRAGLRGARRPSTCATARRDHRAGARGGRRARRPAPPARPARRSPTACGTAGSSCSTASPTWPPPRRPARWPA